MAGFPSMLPTVVEREPVVSSKELTEGPFQPLPPTREAAISMLRQVPPAMDAIPPAGANPIGAAASPKVPAAVESHEPSVHLLNRTPVKEPSMAAAAPPRSLTLGKFVLSELDPEYVPPSKPIWAPRAIEISEREKVYNTLTRVPWQSERVIIMAFFMALDAIVYLFTLLPFRQADCSRSNNGVLDTMQLKCFCCLHV